MRRAGTEIAQFHAGVRRQTCERHTIYLHVQDVAPVFRRTTPKLIVSNLLGMETKLHLPRKRLGFPRALSMGALGFSRREICGTALLHLAFS